MGETQISPGSVVVFLGRLWLAIEEVNIHKDKDEGALK